jgi:hypothetical protein
MHTESCVGIEVSALGNGSFIKLIILPSFPVLPLPIHHEKKKSKLNVNLVESFMVKDSFIALPVSGICFHLALSSQLSLLLSHSLVLLNPF